MATITELRDQTRADLKIDPGKQVWSDTQLTRWLNEAIEIFYAKAGIKEIWGDSTINPLVDGQANYTPPTDFRRFVWSKIVDTSASSTADEGEITNVTNKLGEFQRSRDMDFQDDQPGYIYYEDDELWLWPVPNSTAVSSYTIKFKYVTRPASLTGTGTPEIPAAWHFVFTHYARYRAWSILPEKQAEAASSLQEWEMWWRKALSDILWKEDELLTYRSPVLPSKRPKNGGQRN